MCTSRSEPLHTERGSGPDVPAQAVGHEHRAPGVPWLYCSRGCDWCDAVAGRLLCGHQHTAFPPEPYKRVNGTMGSEKKERKKGKEKIHNYNEKKSHTPVVTGQSACGFPAGDFLGPVNKVWWCACLRLTQNGIK